MTNSIGNFSHVTIADLRIGLDRIESFLIPIRFRDLSSLKNSMPSISSVFPTSEYRTLAKSNQDHKLQLKINPTQFISISPRTNNRIDPNKGYPNQPTNRESLKSNRPPLPTSAASALWQSSIVGLRTLKCRGTKDCRMDLLRL